MKFLKFFFFILLFFQSHHAFSDYSEKVECSFFNFISSDLVQPKIVMQRTFDSFSPSSNKIAAGYTTKYLWIKANCTNKSAERVENFFEIDYPFLHLLNIFSSDIRKPDYSYGRKFNTKSILASIKNRYPLALFKFAPHESKDIFFQIASAGPVIGTINVYGHQEYLEKESAGELGLGIYFGLFLANIILVIFLIFTFIFSRQRSDLIIFVIYLLYVITNTLYQFSYAGLSGVFLWQPESQISVRSVITLSPILVIFLNEYSRRFINCELIAPRLNIFLVMISAINLILVPLCFLGDFSTFSQLMSQFAFCTFIFYFLFSFFLVLKRTPNSLLYFLGWSSFLTGTAILILRNFNVLPFNFFTKHAQQLGTIVEMTFFSISLVNRARIGNRELVKSSAVLQTTAAISHEIKRPFKVVLSEIKGLQVKYPNLANELSESTLPVVNSAFERLNKLIGEYRLISDLKPKLANEHVKILDIAKDAEHEIKDCFPDFCGRIDLGGLSTTVLGSNSAFLKVFENLFENAIEAAGLNTNISFVVSKRLFGGIRIEIQNSGSVIPPEIRDEIFKIYITTKSGGHGLGLTLCKKLIADCGGTISVSSDDKEKNTSFVILIPRARVLKVEGS